MERQARPDDSAPPRRVEWDPRTRSLGVSFLAGGAPWRLVRLSGPSSRAVARWRNGGIVRVSEQHLADTLVRQGLLTRREVARHRPSQVDVVIPVRDHLSTLGPLLAGLASVEGLHVTVVDDGSLDGEAVAELCARWGAFTHRHPQARGPGAARNTGARLGERELLWFLDADLLLDEPGVVLDRLLRALADEGVGAAAPRIVGPPRRGPRAGFESRHGPLDLGPRTASVAPGAAVPYVPTACLLVRREAFSEGFDEGLRVGEDVDFIWRLHDAGWRVRHLGEVQVAHPARSSWRAWWAQRVSYGASSVALAERHPDRTAPLRLDRGALAAWVLALRGAPLARVLYRARVADLATRLAPLEVGDEQVPRQLARRQFLFALVPTARAATRSYTPLLLALLLTRYRRAALAVLALGSAARLGPSARPLDGVLSLADDLAYSSGLWRAAWRERQGRALLPVLTGHWGRSPGRDLASGVPRSAPPLGRSRPPRGPGSPGSPRRWSTPW